MLIATKASPAMRITPHRRGDSAPCVAVSPGSVPTNVTNATIKPSACTNSSGFTIGTYGKGFGSPLCVDAHATQRVMPADGASGTISRYSDEKRWIGHAINGPIPRSASRTNAGTTHQIVDDH